MAGRFTVETVFKAVDRITAPVSRMQNRVGKFTRGMERGLRRVDRVTGKFFGGLKRGAVAASVALALVSAAFADVVRVGADFEQQIVNATVKMAGIDKSSAGFTNTLRDLEEAARKQGATTEFTASQSAEALNNLARSGLNVSQAIAALPGAIDFATTSETDLTEATETATGALSVFGLKVADSIQLGKNLARVNDVLALTANSSKASMADLAETLQDGGGAAKLAGADVETFGALAAFMAEGLIKGTKAGTAMKNMMTKLADPSQKAQRIFRKFKVDVKDSNGDFNDIADILGQLEKGLVGVGSAEKTAILKEVFGLRAVIGVTRILESGVDSFRDYRKTLRGANGESRKMAAIMRDTLGGSMKSLSSIVESVKISIFNLRKEELKGLIDGMVVWIRANEQLIASRVDQFITKIATAVAFLVKHRTAIGTTIAVVMGLVIAMKVLIGILTVLNLVMLPITGTGLLIAAGVVLIIAAVAGLVIWLIKMKDSIAEAFGSMKPLLDQNLAPFKIWFEVIRSNFLIMVAVVKAVFKIWLALFTRAFSFMAKIIKMHPIVKLIMDNWEPIKEFFAVLWGGIVEIFNSAAARILSIVSKITNIAGKIRAISGGITSKITGFGDSAANFISGEGGDGGPQVVSPQDRTARRIEERRSVSSAEVTLKSEKGTSAEVTGGKLGNGLTLLPSGAF